MEKRVLLTVSAAFAAVSLFAAVPKAPGFTAALQVTDSNYSVEGTITAPTGYTSGTDALTSLWKIELIRSNNTDKVWNEVIQTFENPEPGEVIDWQDKTIQVGNEYQYWCVAYVNDSGDWDSRSNNSKQITILVGQKPALVTDFNAVSDKGNPPMTITFTAPAKDTEGKDLTALKEIKLSARLGYGNYEAIHVFENPVPGKECSYVWEDAVTDGSYTFQLDIVGETGSNQFTSSSYLCGVAAPNGPVNVQAEQLTPSSVKITWEAPTSGKGGGYFDPSTVRYKVARYINYSNQLIPGAQNLETLEFIDEGTDLTEPTKVSKYVVIAYNDNGSSEAQTQNAWNVTFTVGKEQVLPPAELPFAESFDKQPNSWTYDASNKWVKGSGWQIGTFYGISGTPQGAKGGYIYLSGDAWSGTIDTYIESPRLTLENVEYPVLSFYLAGQKNDSFTYGVDMMLGDDEEVALVENTSLEDVEGLNASSYSWIHKTIALEKYAGQQDVRFIFNADFLGVEGYSSVVLAYDEIIVADYPGVADLAVVSGEDLKASISWTAPKNSFDEAPVSYKLNIDGEEFTSEEPEYEFTGEEGENYTVTVTPVYSVDILGKVSDAVPFSFIGTGVGSINTAEGVSTYFDLNGRRVINPAEGSVIVKRTVRANGEVTTEKVVF